MSINFKIRLLLFILALLNAAIGTAQFDSLITKNLSLEELMNIEVVSATRSKVKLSKAPANIMVITAKEIKQRGYRTLEEIFKDIPGFDFTTGQPSGEFTSHMLFRGVGDVGQTKIVLLVDGIPQNDISNGWIRNVGFDQNILDIERIEIISGPGSALFGANAYAGMVNIITKKATSIFETNKKGGFQIRNSIGNYNTYSSELFANIELANDFALQLSGRYYYSQGDLGVNRYDPGNYFHNNFEPDSVLTTEHGNIVNDKNNDGSRKALNDGFNTNINNYYFRGKLIKNKFTMGFNTWRRNEGLGNYVVGYEYFANSKDTRYSVDHTGSQIHFQYDYNLGSKTELMSRMYIRNSSIRPNTGFIYTYQYQSVDNGIDSATADKIKAYNAEGFFNGGRT